jgi:hypothetical protein
MLALVVAAALAAAPAGSPDLRALEKRLARSAREMVPGSLEAAASPEVAPYHLVVFLDAQTSRPSGAAIDGDDVVLSSDPEGLARLLQRTHLIDRRGGADALELWRHLEQVGAVLGEADLAGLPEDERRIAHAPKLERRGTLTRALGFLRQGEQVYGLALELDGSRARATLTPIGELLGRDDLAEAVRALESREEIVRATAALELGGSSDVRAAEGLVTALSDASEEVRAAAAEGLQRQGRREPALAKRVEAALRKAHLQEKSPRAKAAMEQALTALKAAPARPGK